MTFFDKLVPYAMWFKLLAILAVLAVVGYGGYQLGSAHQTNVDKVIIEDLNKKLMAEVQGRAADKTAFEVAKTKLANDSLATLVKAQQEASAKEDELRAQVKAGVVKYQNTLKEHEREKAKALALIREPFISSDPLTNGMWVDVALETCSGIAVDQRGYYTVSEIGRDSTGLATSRCRLHTRTAERLVEFAASGNSVIAAQQLCYDTLKAASEVKPSEIKSTLGAEAKSPEEK